MIAPARNLGKYEIRQKLGRGGMADVYLALDTALGHPVALKLIEHADDADTRDSIEAERRGAELQAQLAEVDGHVARIYDCGDLESYFYVAMEYVEGEDLAARMRIGGQPQALPADTAVDTAIAVAGTLESAHQLEITLGGKSFRGIVHGDIKPKNIRIDTRGEVRVLDFGIAKALSVSRKLTRNEFGSVPYASPERLTTGEVDFQSDLWSLAVMLYEMVTGLQPYHADTTERLERMIRSRIPPPPAPDPCPEPLRRILVKAMMPEPELRYGSAREFANDLIMFRTGGPVRAVAEDLDATRRTFTASASDDADETRRTTAPRAADVPLPRDEGLTSPPKAKTPQTAPRSRARRASLAVALFALGFLGWEATAGYLLHRHGQQLATAIETEQLTSPAAIWTQWTELSKDNPSSVYLGGARKAVKQRLVEAADRVIANYRSAGTVSENAWKGARDELMHALTLGPDESVRGKLRLAEGHLERIGGEAHHRQADLDDALEKFTEAEHLLPASPDPPLAEARLELHSFADPRLEGHSVGDYDRAYAALQVAEKRGYSGKAERGDLADGYRARANKEFWSSSDVRGLPQEKDLVARARDDYERALGLYQGIVPYRNSTDEIQSVQESLDSVNFRLKAIENPPTESHNPLGTLKKLLHIWR